MKSTNQDTIILCALYFIGNALIGAFMVFFLHFGLLAGIVGCCVGTSSSISTMLIGKKMRTRIVDPEYVSPPPQGGDATIPVISHPETQGGGQSNSALLGLMKHIEREINARSARAGEAGPSDDRYEAIVAYPSMEMEQEL